MLLNRIRQTQNTLLNFTILYHNHYETLNLSPQATEEQIKSRYKYLAKKYHPDTHYRVKEADQDTQNPTGSDDNFKKYEQNPVADEPNAPKAEQSTQDKTENGSSQEKTNNFQGEQSSGEKQAPINDYKDFIKIKEAYDVLKNYNTRRQYDNEIFPEKMEKQAEHFYYYRSVTSFQEEQEERKAASRKTFRGLINYAVAITTAYLLYNYSPMFRKVIEKVTEERKFIQPQNMNDSIAAQESRKKYYAAEMKAKKIYGNVIELKVRGAGEESTRSKEKRKKGLCSIEGVIKEPTLEETVDLIQTRKQYM